MNGPEIYGTIFFLVPSSYDENTLWAGSDDGLVHITQDHGKSWRNITHQICQKIQELALLRNLNIKLELYILLLNAIIDDRKPYLWKTNDYGKTWIKIINGIRNDEFLHVIREDLKFPVTLCWW